MNKLKGGDKLNRKMLFFSVAIFLCLLTVVPQVYAAIPVKMVDGKHYAGIGSMRCGVYRIYGPIHVVVNEDTGEISARVKPYAGYLLPNYGFSSVFSISVEGTITGKEVFQFPGGTVTWYYFSFSEHYHGYVNHGAGTGHFQINDVYDYISVGLIET